MSPNTAKKKCKNFLSTLIRLADEQPAAVAKSVRNLIQGIIVSNSVHFLHVYDHSEQAVNVNVEILAQYC